MKQWSIFERSSLLCIDQHKRSTKCRNQCEKLFLSWFLWPEAINMFRLFFVSFDQFSHPKWMSTFPLFSTGHYEFLLQSHEYNKKYSSHSISPIVGQFLTDNTIEFLIKQIINKLWSFLLAKHCLDSKIWQFWKLQVLANSGDFEAVNFLIIERFFINNLPYAMIEWVNLKIML